MHPFVRLRPRCAILENCSSFSTVRVPLQFWLRKSRFILLQSPLPRRLLRGSSKPLDPGSSAGSLNFCRGVSGYAVLQTACFAMQGSPVPDGENLANQYVVGGLTDNTRPRPDMVVKLHFCGTSANNENSATLKDSATQLHSSPSSL